MISLAPPPFQFPSDATEWTAYFVFLQQFVEFVQQRLLLFLLLLQDVTHSLDIGSPQGYNSDSGEVI